MSTPSTGLSRRGLLRLAGVFGATGATAALLRLRPGRQAVAAPDPTERRYLFVVAAMGGASIIDSFLPVAENESAEGLRLTTLPASLIRQPPGSNLRCVAPIAYSRSGYRFGNGYSQEEFLGRHKDDVAVVQATASSVNHATAQLRAMTGDGVDGGRTIAEAAAAHWGGGLLLPNCNMASASYAFPGADPALPELAEQTTIADAKFFALSTDGVRGIAGAPGPASIASARRLRDHLDQVSPFGRRFGHGPDLQRYFALRRKVEGMETSQLISKLMIAGDDLPLDGTGIAPTPHMAKLMQTFPLLREDPFEAQAALAFLLARHGVACATTISPDANMYSRPLGAERQVIGTQLAFDYSHTDHRIAQSVMWSRILSVVDGLIGLLKTEDVDGDPAKGKMWDRSLVYIATDFGRDKVRPEPGADGFGTAHHLNNGVVLLSPKLRGNRVYGGVDPRTCLTHGFDRITGEPAQGQEMSMRDVYSVIAAALDIPFQGRISIPSALRT